MYSNMWYRNMRHQAAGVLTTLVHDANALFAVMKIIQVNKTSQRSTPRAHYHNSIGQLQSPGVVFWCFVLFLFFRFLNTIVFGASIHWPTMLFSAKQIIRTYKALF